MIRFANIWVLSVLVLFYLGPIPWPGAKEPWTALLLLTSLLAYNVGWYLTNVSNAPRFRHVVARRSAWIRSMLTPTVSLIVLLVLAVLTSVVIEIVTGRSMLSLASYSLDHERVYASFQINVAQQARLTVAEQLIIVAKSILFPIGLIAFAMYFRTHWWISVLFLGPMVASAFMRGTDKETFDVAMILLMAMLYHRFGLGLLKYAAVLALVVAILFIQRKVARYGGELPTCLPNTLACLNPDSFASAISPNLEFGIVMMSSYVTNGLQGLSIAFSLPFDFGWGVGHLPPVKRVLCQSFRLHCEFQGYNERLVGAGWDTRFRWSSAYTALANDFTFFGIPFFMLLLGRATRLAETAWNQARDPMALAALIMIGIFFAYSSANMQVAISLEWAFAWVTLVYLGYLVMPPFLKARAT